MKFSKNKILSSFIFLIIAVPLLSFAQNPTITNPTDIDTIKEFLEAAGKYLWVLVAPLATIMMVWAGILFATSQGDPEKIRKARSLVTYIVVGIAVAILAWGLASILENLLTV